MKALGSIIWDGINADCQEDQENFWNELESRNINPDTHIWLLDTYDGWYVERVADLPFLGNISKALVESYSWSNARVFKGQHCPPNCRCDFCH
jgi:hypothetical protein